LQENNGGGDRLRQTKGEKDVTKAKGVKKDIPKRQINYRKGGAQII